MDYMDSLLGKAEHYLIRYKDSITGKIKAVPVEAHGKSEAEELFRRHFRYSEIVKIQDNEEIAQEIVDNIFKGVRKDLERIFSKDKKQVIDPKKVKKLDYNSKSFKKGLAKVNKKFGNSLEMSVPNHERKYLSYSL